MVVQLTKNVKWWRNSNQRTRWLALALLGIQPRLHLPVPKADRKSERLPIPAQAQNLTAEGLETQCGLVRGLSAKATREAGVCC